MIIQIANIVSGFLLAAPKLKEWGAKQQVEKAQSKLVVYSSTIGIIELVIGVIALLDRMGIIFYVPSLGASYPQAIPAILIGLILSARRFEKHPSWKNFIVKISGYQIWLGLIGILVGLWSLLFGCNLSVVCTMFMR